MDTLSVENVRCDDPQFIEVLIVCLHKEITACKQILSSYEMEGKKVKARVCVQISLKKEGKHKIKEIKESVLIFISINQKLDQHIEKATNCIRLVNVNADDMHRINALEMVQHQNILNEYTSIWSDYQMQYEQFSLAKSRMEEYINVQHFLIDHMIIEHKINKLKKGLCNITLIDWIRTQAMIINLCKLLQNQEKKCRNILNMNKSISSYKKEYRLITLQLNKRCEEQAEQERIRTQRLLEMPPPKMNLSHIYLNLICKNQWTGIQEQWKRNTPASDSISTTSILLEEIINIDEDPMELCKDLDNSTEKNNSFAFKHDKLETNDTMCNDNNINQLFSSDTEQVMAQENPQQSKQFLLNQVDSTMKQKDNPLITASTEPLNNKDNCEKKKQPEIKTVENIRFNILNPKTAQINSTNLFSPRHYDYCGTNLNECLETDFQNKDSSTCEESLNNFNVSKCSNISSIASVEAEKGTELYNTSDNTDDKDKFCEKDARINNSPQYNFVDVLKKKPSHFSIF